MKEYEKYQFARKSGVRFTAPILTATALIMACAGLIHGQSNSITGTVRDPGDGAVSDATVVATQGSIKKATHTGPTGTYALTDLNSGQWQLVFTRSGFMPTEKSIAVAGGEITLDVVMKISDVQTSVDVIDGSDRTTASRMAVSDTLLPVQVNTVSQEVLKEQGSNDLVTALRNVSGVTAFRSYGMYEYYTIRGFNTANVVLVDGMRLEGNRLNTQMNNVEQVEVLKGPGSVLYGGQALSGTINIVRKKPQAQPVFEAYYRSGRFNTHQGGVGTAGSVFNLPWLLYRVDTSLESADAWRDAGTRRFNVTPAITWLASERIRLTVTEAFNRDNFAGDAGVPADIINRPDYKSSWRFNTPNDFAHNRDSQTQAQLTFELAPSMTLRDSFLYRWDNDEYFTAEQLTYMPVQSQVARTYLYFKHHRRPWINQSDLTGAFRLLGMKHTYVAGYEYQDYYNFTYRSASRSVAATSINVRSLLETAPPVTDFPLSRIDYFAIKIGGLFWQDQIALTERLHVNVGGRFDNYGYRAHNDPWANGVQTGRPPDTIRNQTAYTYRAGVVYSLPASQQLYFGSSSSFQPVTTVPADGRELKPETGRSYEAGYRWQGFHGRLQTSVAAWSLLRQNVVIGLPNAQYEQAGQQSAKGIDFDAVGRLSQGVLLTANYGFTQPRYDDYWTSSKTVNLAGFRPKYTQKHAANVWLTKSWRSGLRASVGSRMVSSMFTSDLDTLRLGGWVLFNGAMGFQRGRWDWSVNAENLLNRQRYFLPASYANQVYPGAPVNVFTTLRFRYGK